MTDAEKAARKAEKASVKPAAPTCRKAKPARKADAPASPVLPPDVSRDAAAEGMSPLDYMLNVMRTANADPARRDRMAIAAAPFVHPRREPVGEGKREKAAMEAKDAVGRGKFSAAPPPKLAAVGGKKV